MVLEMLELENDPSVSCTWGCLRRTSAQGLTA
jgi:hypothetical protein